MTTEPSREALLGDLFAAIDARSTQRFVGFLAPQATFRFGNAPPTTGRTAIAEQVGDFFASIAALSHDIDKIVERADTVVCEGTVRYTRHDGGVVTLPFANVFDFAKDNRIQGYRIYADVTPLYADAV